MGSRVSPETIPADDSADGLFQLGFILLNLLILPIPLFVQAFGYPSACSVKGWRNPRRIAGVRANPAGGNTHVDKKLDSIGHR